MLFKKKERTKPEDQEDIFELPEMQSVPQEKKETPNFLEPMAKQDESIELSDEEEVSTDQDYGQNRNKFIIPESDFGPFLQYIKDPEITDVDYNGQDMWVTDVHNRKTKTTKEPLSNTFIERFVRSVANAKSFDFNQKHPVMEAETKELRISIVHESRAVSGTSICIRKTPPFNRITEKYAIDTNYASREIISLLANCIKAHMNIIVAGQPRAGKTELAKFLGCYIPDSERVITIEDVMEWRFKQLKPKADCIEMQTDSVFTYSDAIIASLKQNPNWIMIAETRGEEVASLINGFSTGVNGITTLHTDDVRKIPQRMLNMVNETNAEQRMLSNIYEFVDVGILVAIRKNPETGERYRVVDQIGMFTFDEGKMGCHMVVENGVIVSREFPREILHKFGIGGIKDNHFRNDTTDSRLEKQGYQLNDRQKSEEKKSISEKKEEPAENSLDGQSKHSVSFPRGNTANRENAEDSSSSYERRKKPKLQPVPVVPVVTGENGDSTAVDGQN